MAHVVNPHNLDIDDDAVFSAMLSQGLIWIEDDDDTDDEIAVEAFESIDKKEACVLKGHTDKVNSLAISGDFVISASSDKTLRVWNWKTGQHLRTLNGHADRVNNVDISGDFAISASTDKTLRVWNWKTGQHLRTCNGFTHGVSTLRVAGDVVLSASFGEIWLWNWKTGAYIKKLAGFHRHPISNLAVDGELVLSASSDLLLVRNWQTDKSLHRISLDEYSTEIENYALDNDFAVLIDYGYVELWDWKNGEHLDKVALHSKEYGKIARRVFSTPAAVGIYDAQKHKWYVDDRYYDMDLDAIVFVDNCSHALIAHQSGAIYVHPTTPHLRRLATGKNTTAPQHKTSGRHKTAPSADYRVDDVLQATRSYILKRNEKWVNFSRVIQYLHEAFPDFNVKALPNKSYKSWLTLFADYPADFELRPDSQKQGLYWIRLQQKR